MREGGLLKNNKQTNKFFVFEETVMEPPPPQTRWPVKWTHEGKTHDYEGLYELGLDEAGQICVFSLPRPSSKGKLLKPKDDFRVGLYKDGSSVKFFIYAIWMHIVVGPPPNDGKKYTVDHIDRDHHNNTPSNLRWADASTQVNNRDKFTRSISWVSFHGDDERREFKGRHFTANGLELRQLKSGVWNYSMNRKPGQNGYVSISIDCRDYLLQRLITHLFGDSNGARLDDIDDYSFVVDHIDEDKTNNRRENLIICTQSNNMQAWHDRGLGNSNKRRVYAKRISDGETSEYPSCSAAEKQLEISPSCVGHVCRKRKKTAGGYIFSYEPFV